MDEDGFTTIVTGLGASNRGRRLVNDVAFGPLLATIPRELVARSHFQRVMWDWDGKNTLRMRFVAEGGNAIIAAGEWSRSPQTSVRALYRALGRTLHGRYPIIRSDGTDIYIDISEQP